MGLVNRIVIPGLALSMKFSEKFFRILKILQIFFSICIRIKIPWKKFSYFLSENLAYQQTLRKSPQKVKSLIFLEKSDKFGVASWTKFRVFSMGYFHVSHRENNLCLYHKILLLLPSHLEVFSTKKSRWIGNIVIQFHSQKRSQLSLFAWSWDQNSFVRIKKSFQLKGCAS